MLAKAHLEHSCFCKFHFLFLWSSSIAQACSNDLAISNINITCPTWFVLPTHTLCVSLQLEPCVESRVARRQCQEGFYPFRMSSPTLWRAKITRGHPSEHTMSLWAHCPRMFPCYTSTTWQELPLIFIEQPVNWLHLSALEGPVPQTCWEHTYPMSG